MGCHMQPWPLDLNSPWESDLALLFTGQLHAPDVIDVSVFRHAIYRLSDTENCRGGDHLHEGNLTGPIYLAVTFQA